MPGYAKVMLWPSQCIVSRGFITVEWSALFPWIWNGTVTIFKIFMYTWVRLWTSYSFKLISLPNSVSFIFSCFNYYTLQSILSFLVFNNSCYSWEWRFSSHCSRRATGLWVFILYLVASLNSSLIAFQLILLDF